jgi:peptide-methionine (S)-S-oxide reductase
MTHLSDELPFTSAGAAASERATFAAGCFWGVEAAFRELDGVLDVTVGYTGGATPDPTYEQVCRGATGHAEAVEVVFDPATVSYRQLLDTFWHIHNPTTLNRQGWDLGSQYRSAIFFHDREQERLAVATRDSEQASLVKPIVTEIVPAATFHRAEEYHQRSFERSGYAACGVTIEIPSSRWNPSGGLVEPEVRLEQGAKLHPPAMEAALERRLADPCRGGGLLGREPFEVAQDDGGAQVGGQLGERPLEHLLELLAECAGLGARTDRIGERGDGVVVAGPADGRRG